MKKREIITLIKIGFDRPKYYKRSTWNKAVKVMNYLVENTNGEVQKIHTGFGLAKYNTKVKITKEKINEWANQYKRSLDIPVVAAIPELKEIAKNMNLPVNDGRVLREYFNK